MRKSMILLLLVAMLSVGVFAGVNFAQDPLAAIDAAYAKRNGSGQQARVSLTLAEQAFANGGGFEAAWRVARACFWICDRSEDKKVDLEYGKKGWDWGKKAAELAPNRVEGHYFGCIASGEYGKGVGIAKAIWKGMGGHYESQCNKAIAIDASYERGGPLRAMGRYYQVLPKLVRKLDKALDYLKKSEKAAPCMTRTRFYLVELYKETGEIDKAKQTAQTALTTANCAEHNWECEYYKNKIKKSMP